MKRNVFFMAGMVMFFVACTSKEEDVGKEEPSFVMEAVDLGLSVKWAKCNIGATKPEEYGDYFAWGEKEPHYIASWKGDAGKKPDKNQWKDSYSAGYDWSNYRFGDSNSITKYTKTSDKEGDGKNVLEPEDDVARSLGEGWRMPTREDFDALYNNCYWVWCDGEDRKYDGTNVAGYIVFKLKDGMSAGICEIGETPSCTTEDNPNYIFLPAAGSFAYDCPENFSYTGSDGYFWSSSLYEYDAQGAYCLCFISYINVNQESIDYRCNGQSIRAVYVSNE